MAEGARHGPHVQPIDMGAHQITHVADATELDGAAALGQVPVVAADALDTTPANWGPLDEKLVPDASARAIVITTGPTRQLEVGAVMSTEIPLPNSSTGSPGTTTAGTQAAAHDHQHIEAPPPPATTTGAVLYAAKLKTTNLLLPVRCLTSIGTGYGLAFANWTKIAGAAGTWTWRRNSNAPIKGWAGSDPEIDLAVGDRVLVPCNITSGPAEPSPYVGVYEVLVVGDESTPAEIRRVEDANTSAETPSGTTVYIDGDPTATYYHTYWQLTTADPITIDVTSVQFFETAYTPTVSKGLKTWPEMAGANIDDEMIEQSFEIAPGLQTLIEFPTTGGGCGLTSLPAGIHFFQCYGVSLGSPLTPEVYLRATTFKWTSDPAAGTDLFYENSQPFSGVNPQALRWPSSQAEIALSQGDNLGLRISAYNSTEDTITVKLRWNSGAPVGSGYLATRWETTAQFPSTGGTNRHNDLIGRDQDVASATPAVADPCHPACAIGAGIFHTPLATDAAAYDAGRVTLQTDTAAKRGANFGEVTITGNIECITSDGFLAGDCVELLIHATHKSGYVIKHNGSGGDGAATIYNPQADVATGTHMSVNLRGEMAVARFRLMPVGGTTYWVLMEVWQ